MLRGVITALLCAVLPLHAYGVDNITLFTGQKTGTYYAFGKDMAQVLSDKQLTLDVRDSEGSVDNIKRIKSADKVMLGIVQSDVLGFLNRSQNSQSRQIVSRLRVAFPLYQEEVHVLARKDIAGFKDLQGKKVAIGEEGGGHMLTAVNLFAIEKITPASMKKISPEEGIVAVLKGELDAVIFVGGKPVKIFKNMEDLTSKENQKFALLLQDVHFLPLNDITFYSEYEPAEITPRDYSFVKSTVPTIAVQALLTTYEPTGKALPKRCEILQKFARNLRAKLSILKQAGHPKWQEVNLSANTLGWKKEICVGR